MTAKLLRRRKPAPPRGFSEALQQRERCRRLLAFPHRGEKPYLRCSPQWGEDGARVWQYGRLRQHERHAFAGGDERQEGAQAFRARLQSRGEARCFTRCGDDVVSSRERLLREAEENLLFELRQRQPMELRHLRYFVTVAKELNFSRASARLRVSQPAVSRQIRTLEDEVGAPLFVRAPGKLRLRLLVTLLSGSVGALAKARSPMTGLTEN